MPRTEKKFLVRGPKLKVAGTGQMVKAPRSGRGD